MSYSKYLEQNILDHVFKGSKYPVPSLYVALFTDPPDNTGSGGTEVSGGSYARQSIDFDAATGMTPASTDSKADVQFPAATADWGTIKAVGIYDASSGGNMLLFADLVTNKTVSDRDIFTIPAGNFTIQLD